MLTLLKSFVADSMQIRLETDESDLQTSVSRLSANTEE